MEEKKQEDSPVYHKSNVTGSRNYFKRVAKKLSIFTWLKIGLVIVIISLVLGFMFQAWGGYLISHAPEKIKRYIPETNSYQQRQIEISRQQIILEDSAITQVAQNSLPAVVSIMISKNVSSYQSNQFIDPFTGFPLEGSGGANQSDSNQTEKQVVGAGSGFIFTTDGMILTNKHVVSDKELEYMVITQDGKEYPVKILAQDPIRDAAIIKIDGFNFPILNLGDSDNLKIGQTVVAIGDSLGEFSNSVSRGIISGLKRNVNATSAFGDTERLTDIIQTDAAINLGGSGGPLLDINGNVIGLNVARAQSAENVAFALPINQVKRIIDQVKSGAKISLPYLGVRYIVIDSLVKVQAKIPVDYGVLVTRGSKATDFAVIPGSPADLAGIIENDIILEINGEKITKDNQLGDMIAKYKVGDTITLKIWHRGQEKNISVTLEELKQ